MQVVRIRAGAGARHAKTFGVIFPSVPTAGGACIDLFVELWRVKMKFAGIDAYDRAILLVKLVDMERVLSAENDVVVAFVPRNGGSEIRANMNREAETPKTPETSPHIGFLKRCPFRLPERSFK